MWNKIFVVVERQPYSFSGVLTQIKAMNLNAVAKKEKTRLDRSSYLPQWLNPRAGKMKQILHSGRSGFAAFAPQGKVLFLTI